MKKEETWLRNNITEIKTVTLTRLSDIENEMAKISDLESKFLRLNGTNQIWRENFKVIKKTIAELKQKKMIIG